MITLEELEKRKAELEQARQNLIVQHAQIQGALALCQEMIEKLKPTLEEQKERNEEEGQ